MFIIVFFDKAILVGKDIAIAQCACLLEGQLE
jgi:hypothetical protein